MLLVGFVSINSCQWLNVDRFFWLRLNGSLAQTTNLMQHLFPLHAFTHARSISSVRRSSANTTTEKKKPIPPLLVMAFGTKQV